MSTRMPYQSDALQRRRAKTARRRRRNLVIGTVLVALVLLIGRSVVHFWNRPLATASGAPNPVADTNRFTVLILGADDRPGEPGRSDTMLLGFVDLDAGSVQLLSIPRDSYAEIPGHGWDKINAAYAYGKEDLTRQAVEKLIGRSVDYTVTVNMGGFEKIVDTLGGIDINIDENMDYDDPYDTPPLHIHLQAGQKHLDGVQALGYVRFRHDAQSDWGRMKRQQQFLKALLNAAKRPVNLAQLPRLLPLVSENVRTNLSPAQITKLALIAKDKLGDQSIIGQTLTGTDLWTSEGYYLALDFGKMRETIRQLSGESDSASAIQKDTKDEAAYKAALPAGSQDASAYTGGIQPAGATAPGTQPGTQPGTPGNGQAGSSTGKQPGTQPGGQSGTPTGTQPGTQPGSSTGKSGTPPTTQPGTPDTSATPPTVGSDGPPWPLVVVDGTGDTQGALLSRLQAQGFRIVSIRPATGVTGTTIVWYGGSAAAAERLKVLLPDAQLMHMTPGPNDPPLKLVLGPR